MAGMGSLPESHLTDLPAGYRLLRFLGRGAYGEVWHAEAPGGVEVAVKIIPRTRSSNEPEAELQALHLMRGLRHQNLLSLQAFFPTPDRLFIVLELADSCLRRLLNQRRAEGQEGIPAAELLVYMREAAEALDFLHSRELVHRDIKPDNLLLLGSHVKVADYGLARLLDKSSLQTATTVGTPSYMAPEVFQGKVSPHSDQYSLAVSYAELRLGRPPLQAENLGQMMFQHLYAEPDLGALPAAERQVLRRALAKDPYQRFPSCTAMVAALREALAGAAGAMEIAPQEPTTSSNPEELRAGRKNTGPMPDAASTLAPPQGQIPTTVAGSRVSPSAGWRSGGARSRRRVLPVLLVGGAVAFAVAASLWAAGILPWPVTGTPDSPAPESLPVQASLQRALERPTSQAASPKPVMTVPAPRPAVTSPMPPMPPPVPAALEILPISALVLEAGQDATVDIRIRRQNCPGPVRIEVTGLPAGVEAQPAALADGEDTVHLKLRAQKNATEETRVLGIRAERGTVHAEQIARLTLRVSPRLAITVPPLTVMVPQQLRYFGFRIERQKVAGPVELDVGAVPEGLRILARLPLRVPADRDTACLALQVTEAAAPGERTLRIRASAAGLQAEGTLRLTVAAPRPWQKQLAEDKDAIQRAPRDPIAYVNRALTYRKLEDRARALADYQEAIRLDPTFARAYHSRGNYYLRLKEYSKALADLNEAIRLDPDSYPHVYRERGEVYLEQKNRDQALNDFNTAIRLNPGDSISYFRRGVALHESKKPGQALADLDQAIQLNPGYSRAFNYRGLIYLQQGDRKKALADYDRAIQADPNFALAFRNRGTLHRLQKEPGRALPDLNEAIRLEAEKYPYFYRDRALVFMDLKDPRRALSDFGMAIRLNPKDSFSYFERGVVHFERKELDEALADFEEVVRLNPRHAAALNYRGAVYLKKGDRKKALAEFDQAIQVAPKYALAYRNRGNVYRMQKDYDRAIADLTEAIRLDPRQAASYRLRSLVYRARGDKERADQDLRKAQELETSRPELRSAPG